ncbi:cell division protein DivIC [Thermolongibacillus altinsuensis]|uniref:Cell division protein DivIC n=1 Tax=Thermolongibacillus altinsuensis TaxID=575256 RepID=A0A4R1QJ91_9BACL|nr:septum formation initiator family protein [Thermolongibacillus altinsuensis]TCL46100.1 cell division protein DivIC [Thermolongibacillus altinsuensis]
MSVLHKNKVTKIQSSYAFEHEKREKKASKRRKVVLLRFSLFAVMLMALSSVFLYALISQSSAIDAKLKAKERLEVKLQMLKKEEEKLNDEIKKLNDDEYIAELARKEYFFSKEGEIIFTTPED